jgi:PcfK-like protein
MKSTDAFKETIKSYLDNKAETDPLFAPVYANEKKNIEDCCTYILNTVQKSGCSGFADDEVYSMAVHYYDEENIEVGKPVKAQVVVNHSVELSPEEIKQAKEKAIEAVVAQEQARMQTKPAAPKKPKKQEQTFSLFD